jgi:hypothetical protein
VIRDIAKPILFADDTSIVISAADIQEFQKKKNSISHGYGNQLVPK